VISRAAHQMCAKSPLCAPPRCESTPEPFVRAKLRSFLIVSTRPCQTTRGDILARAKERSQAMRLPYAGPCCRPKRMRSCSKFRLQTGRCPYAGRMGIRRTRPRFGADRVEHLPSGQRNPGFSASYRLRSQRPMHQSCSCAARRTIAPRRSGRDAGRVPELVQHPPRIRGRQDPHGHRNTVGGCDRRLPWSQARRVLAGAWEFLF